MRFVSLECKLIMNQSNFLPFTTQESLQLLHYDPEITASEAFTPAVLFWSLLSSLKKNKTVHTKESERDELKCC